MSEEKNLNNTDQVNETAGSQEIKTDDKPIESIEKTVEDLKKKIQEITSDTGEAKAPIDFKLNDEQKEKIETIRRNTVESVSNTINEVRKKADEVKENADVQKTIDFLKANAIKAVDTAKAKITEFYENPDVRKTLDNAGAKARELGDTAARKVDSMLSDQQKEALKTNFEQISGKVVEGVDTASKKINEFVAKPEVQQTIQKTREGARELADKGADMIKDLFDKKDGE